MTEEPKDYYVLIFTRGCFPSVMGPYTEDEARRELPSTWERQRKVLVKRV